MVSIHMPTLKKLCIAVFIEFGLTLYATTKENGYDTLARNGLVNIVISTMFLYGVILDSQALYKWNMKTNTPCGKIIFKPRTRKIDPSEYIALSECTPPKTIINGTAGSIRLLLFATSNTLL